MSTTVFPSELIGQIIGNLELSTDLYRLSFVSRDFNYWAERRLYRRRLRLSTAHPSTWKFFISLAAWPRLAAHIVDLNIHIGFPEPDSNAIPCIEPAFRSMINLTSLTLHINDLFLCAIKPDMEFRLHYFSYEGCAWGMNSEGLDRKLVAFLAAQVKLKRLRLRDIRRVFINAVFPPQILPRVTTLDAWIDDIWKLLPGRSISHLRTRAYRSQLPDVNLITDIKNLCSLDIDEARSLPLFRACFPNLRFLDIKMDESIQGTPYLEEMPVLEKLKSYDYDAWPEALITQSFAACPSLQRIEIEIVDTTIPYSKTWYRGVEEPMKTLGWRDEWMYI